MSTKQPITDRNGVYFITFTCTNWLPLFELTNSYDTVYKWFDVLKEQGHDTIGYVIMPNHLHVLINFNDAQKSINTIVSNAKRFMAYEIIKRLNDKGCEEILEELAKAVDPSDQLRKKKHQVFIRSFDCKQCLTEHFVHQKLSYMHNNPCKGVWNLAPSPVDYPYSSAKFYITGEQGIYPVTNYYSLRDR